MSNVVFMVKNGIGYGHIRRAILLAQELRARTDLRPVIISQAHTLDIYTGAGIPVVNFPLLDRTPSDVAEDCYIEILDALLARLDPAAVVEDTYPDRRYADLASLQGVPRLLVMRRLDGLSFDQLRTRGTLSAYDEILIAQSSQDFAREGHSGASRAAVESLVKFRYVGNIHDTPGGEDIRRARRAAAPDAAPLVVVSAGAGGDQLADGFGDRLFNGCAAVAARLHDEGHPARFVLVTGPYFAGRPVASSPNVTVRRFDPQLSALLAAADVAVIKPGNNVLSEALLGSANLVLVPDASFMEGVDEHAARTVADFGGQVSAPDADQLNAAIRAALTAAPRTRRTTPNVDGIRHVVERIQHHVAAGLPLISPVTLSVLVQAGDVIADLTDPDTSGRQVARLSALHPELAPVAEYVIADVDPLAGVSLAQLVERGLRVLLVPGGSPSPGVSRWLEMSYAAIAPLICPIAVIRPRGDSPRTVLHRIASACREGSPTAVLLDLRFLNAEHIDRQLAEVAEWLKTQPVQLTSLAPLRRHAADILLRPETATIRTQGRVFTL